MERYSKFERCSYLLRQLLSFLRRRSSKVCTLSNWPRKVSVFTQPTFQVIFAENIVAAVVSQKTFRPIMSLADCWGNWQPNQVVWVSGTPLDLRKGVKMITTRQRKVTRDTARGTLLCWGSIIIILRCVPNPVPTWMSNVCLFHMVKKCWCWLMNLTRDTMLKLFSHFVGGIPGFSDRDSFHSSDAHSERVGITENATADKKAH